MNRSRELLRELQSASLACRKEIGFWTDRDSGTIRDYEEGKVQAFGRDIVFWNGVIRGLCRKYSPVIPPICHRIIGQLLEGTPLAATSTKYELVIDGTLDQALRSFIPVMKGLTEAMEDVAEIVEDGRVDARDQERIHSLNEEIDHVVARLLAIKLQIAQERARTRS